VRIRIVTFGPSIPAEAHAAHAAPIAAGFTTWPGLPGTWWLGDSAAGTCGGVYPCAPRRDAERSRETDPFRGVFANPALKGRQRPGVRRPRRADRDQRTDRAGGCGAPGATVSPGSVPGPVVAGDDLRRVFHDLPQPVAVVTDLGPSGEPVGMTVSSLTSASLTPPLVLFCPAVSSRAWAAARERGSFAVNILGHQHGELAMRFAGPGDRFAGLRTRPTDDAIPVLADALTVLVCAVRDEHPAGDHTVVLGRVRAVHALRDGTGLDTVSLRARITPARGRAARPVPCG
jgi:3-hydroxy-9,10-secoandrosta-1,3,5(10)-triene-9,17-dione monooxygenase reductase component